MSETEETLAVEVWRGGADGAFARFTVPRRPNQTVLDVVSHIQRHLDPSLSYRFACRVGMCGSCAMTVNGRPRWTCRTHVDRVAPDGRLEIAPLAHLPIVRDLVADMAPFFDKWAAVDGRFHGTATRRDPFARVRPDDPRRRRADAGIECIGCGVCYAACDVVAQRPDYPGPAALNRVWTLLNDERDTAGPDRLRKVAGGDGCLACHTHMSCGEHCPKQITPTIGIAGLKRACAAAALKGAL